jgi:2-polyprenyl-3-methyl-5-hydroxy-6-metoxy-1,4-benzoquinol methylase
MPDQESLHRFYQDDRVIGDHSYPKASSRRRRAWLRAFRLFPLVWRKRVIDIGCGGGFLVNAFRLAGGKATGLDVSAKAIRYAQHQFTKCEFFCASFAEFQSSARQFDFIHSAEVIEHVNDLGAYMELLRRLSVPKGYVFITTPDSGSPKRPASRADWGGFAPSAHVGLFNASNLTELFARYGFTAVRHYPDKKMGLKILFQNSANSQIING